MGKTAKPVAKKTYAQHRRDVERAIDRLVDDARWYSWSNSEGKYRRLVLDMALAYYGSMDVVVKPLFRKPKASPKPKRRKAAA